MKRKDMSKGERAWQVFKFVVFNSSMMAFGLGALTILTLSKNFVYPILLILVAPICFFIAWKLFPKKFLKENIKP